MWNPFKKKTEKEKEKEAKLQEKIESMPGVGNLNVVQRYMTKRVLSMSPEKQKMFMEKAMTPKNVEKHKGEIMAQLDALKKSGQLSDDQYRLAKRRLGI